MKNIKRNIYLSRIRPYYGKQLIKTLIGQRRVGKSFLLRQVSSELSEMNPDGNFVFIDKEQFEFDEIKNYRQLYSFIKGREKGQKNFIFIDEIQEITNFEKALRSLLSEGIFDIYCTGSNSKLLSGEMATLLSGRQIIIPIYSLSFDEYKTFNNLPHNKDTLELYFKYGGMPYLIHLPKEDFLVFDYLKNINSTILFRDILSRYKIRDVGFLSNLLHYIADNTGSLTVAKRISDYLKSQGSSKTVSVILNYLTYLQVANLILFAPRYDIRGKRIFENGGKYFYQDHGLRNAISGYKPGDMGKIIENVVFKHLRTLGYNVFVGDLKGKEIDFIAEKQGEKIYFQATFLISSDKVIEREFGNLLLIKDQYPKYVVSMDEVYTSGSYEGVNHISLLDFLNKTSF
ncbi:MAG: ATP-binding protein [Bacteroidales bacterium]|nr:ATP-binding protein [Bacteroidales bacterium]